MEMNQQSDPQTEEQQQAKSTEKQHPGQQLPTGDSKNNPDQPAAEEKEIRHSESSFPKTDRETLGTP